MNWNNYVMKCGLEHDRFWSKYLQGERNILYVLASGFDPRMCDGAESVTKFGGRGRRDCRLVTFHGTEDPTTFLYANLVGNNIIKLERLFGKEQIQTVLLTSERGHDIDLQRNAAGVIKDDDYQQYTDIIVDISSMPTQIFFPLLGMILQRLSQGDFSNQNRPNLFVIVSEDTNVDRAITKSGINEEANFVYGFFGDMDLQAMESGPSVWIPILGENRTDELKRLHQKIRPAETCPVIPSPSRDPKRSDTLLLEYVDILRQIGIDPRNMIYASECNPFDVYRQIRDAIVHYDKVLKPMSIYRFVVSPLSSKLMSVGGFLAAYELTYEKKIKAGIGLVGAARYKFDEPNMVRKPTLFTMWMHGDCYDL